MTAPTSDAQQRVPPVLIGFLGMIVVPFGIVFAANSWSAPDAEAYVRMAFAAVIAHTIAAVAAWWLAINRMRAGGPGRYWFWGVAGLVTLSAVGGVNSAAERLIQVLHTF